jgi:hypothetical protein
MTRAHDIFSTGSVSASTFSAVATPARASMIDVLRRETTGDALATRCALH